MQTSADVAILGAGPAGLAAAWRLAQRGLAVTVLERAPAMGGLAASFDVAGVRVDAGSHRLHPATPPHLLAALGSLLGDDLQLRRRNGRLHVAGRWVGFPLRAGELARTLPKPLLARAAADAAASPLRRPRTDTYAEVLRAGLGPTLYGLLYEPYAEKLWGLPPDRIAGEQARKRVTADTPWRVAQRILRGSRGDGQGQVFHYPRRGFGQLVDALADAATAAGAEIRCSSAVTSIEAGDRPRVVGDGVDLTARHVFSTVPLPVLSRLVRPAPPAAVGEAAGRLRFRAMLLVYVVHEGGRWSPYDAHYVPGPESPVSRLSEPANYRESADDPADRTVLCAEIPCAVGDALWEASDEALAAIVGDAIRALGLPPLRFGGVTVRRVPHVYPVYEVGYEEPLRTLDSWASTVPGVVTFGRLGLFVHDNSHHAMAMAWDAAAAVGPDGGWDPDAWSAARGRFAAHVVED